MTDDSCDLPQEYLIEHNIPAMQLSFNVEGHQYMAYDMPPPDFYNLLRQGKMPVTAQVNMEQAISFMEPLLAQGKDVLYLAFSSGLSGTYNSGAMAAKELAKKYPERKAVVIDTLAASLGQGMLVRRAHMMRDSGATLDEIAAWVTETRLHTAHIVVVDDLMHLHRGGRVSKMSAIAGTVLGIKPIIHMDNDGQLKVIGKIRGRKQGLLHIVDRTLEQVGDTPNDYFMVCHGDCHDDAQFVADEVVRRTGIKDYLINYVGPVIGTHTGPGVVSLFMFANYR